MVEVSLFSRCNLLVNIGISNDLVKQALILRCTGGFEGSRYSSVKSGGTDVRKIHHSREPSSFRHHFSIPIALMVKPV